jgi:hypothetical protein
MPGPDTPSRPCAVCRRAASGRSRYCPRCGRILDRARISLPVALIIAALIEAYDSAADAFRCYYSGACLDTDRPRNPFYLVFDHADPGGSRAVVCARIINEMKKDLLEREFRIVVPALSDHMERGTPFDPGCIGFEKWKRAAVPIPAGRAPPRRVPSGCHVCGGERIRCGWYCARCRRLVRGGCHDNNIREAALKCAFVPARNGFVCRYTHVLLDDRSPKRPCSVSFDHKIPGRQEQVVCAYFVNCMKTDLTDTEFRAVLRELTNHWRLGTPFETGVIDAGRYAGAAARRRPPS